MRILMQNLFRRSQSHKPGIIALTLVLAVLLGLGLGDLDRTIFAPKSTTISWLFVIGIGVLLALLCLSCYYEHPQVGILNPSFVVIGYAFLLYVGRPIYVLTSGDLGSTQIGRFDLTNFSSETNAMTAVMFLAFFGWAAAYRGAPTSFLQSILASDREVKKNATMYLTSLALVATACGYIVFRDLTEASGGWQAALTDRRALFEGKVTLIWLMNLYRYGVLIWLGLLCIGKISRTRFSVYLALGYWLFALVLDFMTGSRAEIVLRNLLPTAVILLIAQRQRGMRKSQIGAYISTGLILVFVFVGYRTFVRDAHINPDQHSGSALLRNIRELPTYVLQGDEASAYDYLIVTYSEVPLRMPHRGGESLVALVEAVFPSQLISDKLERSSHLLTRGLRWDYSLRGGNIAFSGAADLYYSFGVPAIILGYALIGFFGGWIIRSCVRASCSASNPAWPLLVGFSMASAFISVMRADLYEFPLVFVRLGLLIGAYLLLTRPVISSDDTIVFRGNHQGFTSPRISDPTPK